tara:strand:- start:897 stop:1052 length:156 start_codon:yes stop_codon:yes gene_type:complete
MADIIEIGHNQDSNELNTGSLRRSYSSAKKKKKKSSNNFYRIVNNNYKAGI